MKKKVLLLAPTSREYRDLSAIAEALSCELLFEDFAGDFFDRLLAANQEARAQNLEILPLIEEIINRYHRSDLSGVTSAVGYPGMPVAAIMANRLNLTGPGVEQVLLCEHKYYCRIAQQAVVPHATPEFQLIDPDELDPPRDGPQFPFFLKPVKSCFSINANRISNLEMFRRRVGAHLLPRAFLKPLNDLIHAYTDFPLDASYLIAESLLQGAQVSLEGYVFAGRVHTLGIVDSIMYPGTMCFKRFEYPSSLPDAVQDRISAISETFIRSIGYDNALFNIEFMYDQATDEIHIIEVNPKIASQFADLFEKVDGKSSYYPLLQIALGEDPGVPIRQGRFKIAASCVLRAFENQRVVSVPSQKQIDELLYRFPDARVEITASAGRLLSDVMQDGKSFRYCVINIGANSREDLEAKLEICESLLDFQFASPARAHGPDSEQ